MSGFTVTPPSTALTVGDLEDYLAELKAAWSEEDKIFIGELRDQHVYTLHPNRTGLAPARASMEAGYLAIFPINL